MSKNVTTKNEGSVAQPQQGRNAYQQFSDEVRQSGIEGDLLRFTKQGDWVAGADQDEVPEGTTLIMGLNTLKRGWQKWVDNRPVDARMGLVQEGFRPPLREELGDLDEDAWEELDGQPRDPWQDTSQVLLISPDTGNVYTFATSAKSGKTALGEVAHVYGDRLQDGEDPEAMPVVKLMSSSYRHKTYGKIMIPVFELTGEWMTPSQIKPKKSAAATKPAATKPAARAPKALPAPRKPSNGSSRARI